ncbi:MAG TPA: 50S ribosomal protein L35 [Gaiellaceae bacterium]|nr:50S ribosomal protein L35 [Gaiellaceae bacterium]
MKTSRGAKKRFRVTGAGKILRRRRHRITPPGHQIKSRPGKRKRARQHALVAPSDLKNVKKLLGRG